MKSKRYPGRGRSSDGLLLESERHGAVVRHACVALASFLALVSILSVARGVHLHGAPILVAAYNFNQGSGVTLTDVSGNNNHGILTNGPLWTTAGKYGGALTFDG